MRYLFCQTIGNSPNYDLFTTERRFVHQRQQIVPGKETTIKIKADERLSKIGLQSHPNLYDGTVSF